MAFFPADFINYRPTKILFRVDLLREADRLVQEGVGGYVNRHELVNDLVEQGLIGLRYPDGEEPVAPAARSQREVTAVATASGNGHVTSDTETDTHERGKKPVNAEPLSSLSETCIRAPERAGAVIENEIATTPIEPMWGMHNRDAPSAFALARLAAAASDGPVSAADFYESTTEEAWKLAAQLAPFETKGGQKLAVMLPRNPEKPQSAADGFQAFAMGAIARKPDEDGKVAAWGPFYQWGAVGIVGDVKNPRIGLTEAGWKLVKVFDGLDFSLPHKGGIARSFLAFLAEHAAADLWGFQTVLDGAARGAGRADMAEYFRARLNDDFANIEWKGSVADSVASGYVSRSRAWGLLEPKLNEGAYRLTDAGRHVLDEFSTTPTV